MPTDPAAVCTTASQIEAVTEAGGSVETTEQAKARAVLEVNGPALPFVIGRYSSVAQGYRGPYVDRYGYRCETDDGWVWSHSEPNPADLHWWAR